MAPISKIVQKCLIMATLFSLWTEQGALISSYKSHCLSERDCSTHQNLECIQSICDCPKGSIWSLMDNQCLTKEGQNCLKNPNCVQNSTCSNGICLCDYPQFQSNGYGRCYLTHGMPCDYHQRLCSQRHFLYCASVHDSYPEEKRCKCQGENKDFIWDETIRSCVALVGSRCENQGFVTCVSNADCVNEYCQCRDGYSPTPQRECLLRYGSKCNNTEGRMCNKYEFLNCLDGVCDCEFYNQMMYEPKFSMCRMLVDEFCDLTSGRDGRTHECVSNSVCKPIAGRTKGECQCIRGHWATKEKTCSTISNHGYRCLLPTDCDSSKFLVCGFEDSSGHGRCVCENGMFFNGSMCVVQPGRECSRNSNCSPNSYCADGQFCVCNTTYVLNPEKMECIQRWNRTHCRSLENQYVWSFEKDQCLGLLGSECHVDEECVDNAFCQRGKCACKVGAYGKLCLLVPHYSAEYEQSQESSDFNDRGIDYGETVLHSDGSEEYFPRGSSNLLKGHFDHIFWTLLWTIFRLSNIITV